jgi:hypothetical protein
MFVQFLCKSGGWSGWLRTGGMAEALSTFRVLLSCSVRFLGTLEWLIGRSVTLTTERDTGLLTVSTCVRWCLARSELLLNAFVQPEYWQEYGLSPVWDLWWIFKFSSLENAFVHPWNCKHWGINYNSIRNSRISLWNIFLSRELLRVDQFFSEFKHLCTPFVISALSAYPLSPIIWESVNS